MQTKQIFISPLVLIILIGFQFSTFAQDTIRSLAFKVNRINQNRPVFYDSKSEYKIIDKFELIRLANSGDAHAQHELGLKFLNGIDEDLDTAKAFYWIQKAAMQKQVTALYNYGLFLFNGWITEWNPFLAYNNFLMAAEAGMKEAQFIIGVIHTENLIVPKNMDNAYYWLKKSSEGGYDQATDLIKKLFPGKMIREGDSLSIQITSDHENDANSSSTRNKNQTSTILNYIDFGKKDDLIKDISDNILINDLKGLDIKIVNEGFTFTNDTSLTIFFNYKSINELKKLADNGSPEAQTILGRLYQQGTYLNKDILLAAEYYIRAVILDSPRSAFFLWQLVGEDDFFNQLDIKIKNNDPTAQFVFYGLRKLEYNTRSTGKEAIELLQKSVEQNYIPSIIELGFDYYTGKFVSADRKIAIDLWTYAEQLNSFEAMVRIASSQLIDYNNSDNLENEIETIIEAEKEGSLLAQFTLAYCYENGIGIKKDIAKAVKYYGLAASRENQYAYEQIKRLYDSLRPAEKTFKID